MSAPIHIDDTGFAPAPFDLAQFAKRIVIAGIKNARHDDTEYKQRIMLARECGFLIAEEAEEWIAVAGVASA